MLSKTEQGVALRNGLCANLTSKVVETAKQICMNLLQSLYCSWFQCLHQSTFEERISLFLTLTINGAITIGKPFKECMGTVVGIVFGYRLYTIGIQSVSSTLFTIWSLEFEVVSDTHELNALCIELLFEPTPVVTSFHIIVLIIDGTHDVCG